MSLHWFFLYPAVISHAVHSSIALVHLILSYILRRQKKSGNGLGGILEIESGKNEALKALRSWDEIPNGEEGKEKTSHTLKPRPSFISHACTCSIRTVSSTANETSGKSAKTKTMGMSI